MKGIRKIAVVGLVAAFLMVFTPTSAKAEYCCFNPLVLPFLVAGAVVGTAAAITTGILGLPFYGYSSYYYGPGYYYGPSYYSPWYYGPAPVYYGYPYYYRPYYYGGGYGYYGYRGYWNRPAWGPRYNRYSRIAAGAGNRYQGRIAAGGPRYQRGVASAPVRGGAFGNRYSVR